MRGKPTIKSLQNGRKERFLVLVANSNQELNLVFLILMKPSTSSTIQRDGLWSLGSFGIIAISGLLINIVIADSLGRAALGLFNTCLSIILIVGQLSTMGIHSAVAFFVPTALATDRDQYPYIRMAMKLVLGTTALLTFVVVITVEVVGSQLGSRSFLMGMRTSYIALFFFPLTKVLVSYVNGLGNIKAAAIANGSRFLLMLLFLLMFVQSNASWYLLPAVISLAELVVFCGLTFLTKFGLSYFWRKHWDARDIRTEMKLFGRRTLISSFLLDMNTRIDVLILSLLKGAEVVGQYTIASTFSEGLFQMAIVTRLVIDPRIAGLNAAGLAKDLMQFLKRHVAKTYLVMIPVITISIFLYSPAVDLLFSKENASGSQEIFIFLALGVLIASGFIPLTNLLNQLGDPLGQSLLLLCVTGLNILGNFILIPSMGAAGAALATALSQAIFVPLLILFVKTRRGLIFNLGSK